MNYAEAIMAFINDELADPDDEELTVDEDLLVSERIDSLGLMRLIAHIGSELGIQVPYEDIVIENFRSVQAMDDYLKGQAASIDA
jgi:acyl carrier protein